MCLGMASSFKWLHEIIFTRLACEHGNEQEYSEVKYCVVLLKELWMTFFISANRASIVVKLCVFCQCFCPPVWADRPHRKRRQRSGDAATS